MFFLLSAAADHRMIKKQKSKKILVDNAKTKLNLINYKTESHWKNV